MDSADADTLKHFLKGIQKDDSPSKVNLANLKKWESQLKKISHVVHPESLMKCVIKFIDFVVNYATSQSPQSQHSFCKDSFGILREIITPELKNMFVKQVTKRIFDIIIEENADSWCMKRELLKVFNFCIESSDKMVRNKTVEEFSDMYIYKIVDSISSCGDYDLQVQLIETVFRMYGQITINNRLKDLIPESQELSQSFAEINDETFDEDIRTFLNNLNKTSGKLFSIVCKYIKVGEVVCLPVMNNIDGLWVDFNLWEATITWYCSTHSFFEDQDKEEDEIVWNLVTLFVSDIESVNIHWSADNSGVIIYCKLSGSCLSSGDYQDILDKANNLIIFVQSSQAANTLITEVLPRLFGKKIQQTSQRNAKRKVSTSKYNEYKALNIKFKRRVKSVSSRCKSDISCTTSLFDPTSGRSTTTKSDESAIQTKRSTSSRSSNIEVITIDSSSEQRSHGARLLSVIPEQDEREPENECNKDVISVKSSETGISSNLAEAPPIQIFSGRCSGSNMSYSRAYRDRVCSTPIKVSTAYDRNPIETERESNKFSQAEIYETAQESLQFPNLTKVGRRNIIDSTSEEIHSADYDSQKTVRIESYNDFKSCHSVGENYFKTITEADSNNFIETHETENPTASSNWLEASAKLHFNSNFISDSLLKKYSLRFPEMTEDYDSMKVNISTDPKLRVLQNHNKEERRPVSFKVSTAVVRDIENINPLSMKSTKMECGNQTAAETKKMKQSRDGKIEVLHLLSNKENDISLDFEDKLILTSDAIEDVPLKRGAIDKVNILKKVSTAIDSTHKKVSTKIAEEINKERSPDESYFNSLEVNIFEDRIKTQKQNYSDRVKSAATPRIGSKVEFVNQLNETSREKKNVIEKDVKRRSTEKILDSKQTSASKVSRNASDNEVRQSKLGEILQKNKEILTTMEANAQASSEDRKMHQDMSSTKTKREISKEKKKTNEDGEKSTGNIQDDKQTSHLKVSTSKVHQDMSRTKTERKIHKEKKKTIEHKEKKSSENIQADKQTSHLEVSTSKVHQDLSKTKTKKEIYKEKKQTIEDVERKLIENIQANKQPAHPKVSISKVHQDLIRTKTEREMYKDKKKTIDDETSSENIQADKEISPPKVSFSKVHQDMSRTKTTREIYKEKKNVIEEDEKPSKKNVQADKENLPPKMSKIASNDELKPSKSDEKLQIKKKVITCKEINAQASPEDSKIHQDGSETATKKEMKKSSLKSKKSEDETRRHETANNDCLFIALKLDKEKVSLSKHRETVESESYKNEREQGKGHPKQKKGDPRKMSIVDIFSKPGISTEESNEQNQDICQSSKSPDLFDNELPNKQNEATHQVLEKAISRYIETSAGSDNIKRDVSSVNVETEKHSESKTIVDSIENISTYQSCRRSKRNKDDLKTVVDIAATSKKQVADKIDLDKGLLEKIKVSNIEDTVLDKKSESKDRLVEQRGPYLDLNENKIGKGKNPKEKQTKSTLKEGGKLRKSTPVSSEDDNIALSEVQKKLLKKKMSSQDFPSLKKVDEKSTSVTMSKTGIMSDLKVSEEKEELGYGNIMKKNEERHQLGVKFNKPEASSLNVQSDNVKLYVPLEDQVNKISSTDAADKSAESEDSCSDNELISDLVTPLVRIDPETAFENLLKTSLPTNHATVKKVRVDLNKTSSSGEVVFIKASSQKTDIKLKGTKQDEFCEDIQKVYEHPDSPIKTADVVKSCDDTIVELTDKIIISESKVRELKSTLKSPKYAIDSSGTENKKVIKEINVIKGNVEKDSPALEKNKKNVKFDSVTPTKKYEEQEISRNETKDPNQTLSTTLSGRRRRKLYLEISHNETKDPNQTLSTTLSGRRRRKLYNPDDLSYLNSVADPVSPTSYNDTTENFNKTEKIKELIFLNRSSNVSVISKKTEGVIDELVSKESNNTMKKDVGKFPVGHSSVFDKGSIERDGTAVLPGIVPLKRKIEKPAFDIGPLKKEAVTKKPRKSISKNEISYRDIKKHQNKDNKKRLKTVNLNTSIINSSGKSHLKSFFENMLDSFREEMGGESLLEKLNKNKVKDSKPEKKSKRATHRLSDTGDKKLRKNRKSERKSKTSSEQSKKRRDTFHSTSLKPKSVKTNETRKTTGDISSSPSLKLPKRFSHPVHKTPPKYAPIETRLPEENNNLPSDVTLDRNNRKRRTPFEDTPSVQKNEEEIRTDEVRTAKSQTKIKILSDIRIRPGRDEVPPSPKKFKMFEGPHLDNETIRENFSQEQDLENADNTRSSQVSPCPVLVSKQAPSWQGVALLDDKIITLKSTDYLKKYLVLFFYPIDFGTLPYVCDPMEIIGFNSRIEDFRRINVEIVACSVDSFFTHNVWVRYLKQEGLLDRLEVPLLSDGNHHISKAYKIYSDHLGHTFRGLFVIDPNGIIVQEIKVDVLSRINVDIFFNWLKSMQSRI